MIFVGPSPKAGDSTFRRWRYFVYVKGLFLYTTHKKVLIITLIGCLDFG